VNKKIVEEKKQSILSVGGLDGVSDYVKATEMHSHTGLDADKGEQSKSAGPETMVPIGIVVATSVTAPSAKSESKASRASKVAAATSSALHSNERTEMAARSNGMTKDTPAPALNVDSKEDDTAKRMSFDEKIQLRLAIKKLTSRSHLFIEILL
jgi:hypothetical protein